jgi:hypothetical protein
MEEELESITREAEGTDQRHDHDQQELKERMDKKCVTHLLKSRIALAEDGTEFSGHDRKWN